MNCPKCKAGMYQVFEAHMLIDVCPICGKRVYPRAQEAAGLIRRCQCCNKPLPEDERFATCESCRKKQREYAKNRNCGQGICAICGEEFTKRKPDQLACGPVCGSQIQGRAMRRRSCLPAGFHDHSISSGRMTKVKGGAF